MTSEEAYREAERRIADARATGAESLDLGDLPLEALPPFGELPRLQALSLGLYACYVEDGQIFWQITIGMQYPSPTFQG